MSATLVSFPARVERRPKTVTEPAAIALTWLFENNPYFATIMSRMILDGINVSNPALAERLAKEHDRLHPDARRRIGPLLRV